MGAKDDLLRSFQAVQEAEWRKLADEAQLNSPRLPPLMTAHEKINQWHRDWQDKDNWVPLTPEELDALADDAIADANAYQEQLMCEQPAVGELIPFVRDQFTCYRCAVASQCTFVYDPYNTGGDCLASK